MGIWNGEVSLRATWDQGGRDRTTQEEGFQVSRSVQEKKGISKGNRQREASKGNNKELRHNLVLLTYVANLRMCIIMIV
jgi:hypothetical protein